MTENKAFGHNGAKDVVAKMLCPYCGNRLILLPPDFPLYDIQCSACTFRAQVKTNNGKPRNQIYGAGWDIMDKHTRSGYMIPPLIANFAWREGMAGRQKIIFYPFIPKSSLKKYTRSPNKYRGEYDMFNYRGLERLPQVVVFER